MTIQLGTSAKHGDLIREKIHAVIRYFVLVEVLVENNSQLFLLSNLIGCSTSFDLKHYYLA